MIHRNLRRRIFVGAEGKGEESFAKFLQIICDDECFQVHLDIRVCGGGDTQDVVEFSCTEFRQRSKLLGNYETAFILVDQDRFEQDKRSGRDPRRMLQDTSIELIWQVPNLEGVLIRLHQGNEQKFVPAKDSMRQLRKLWPGYSKNISAEELRKRFSIEDLRRVAQHDKRLRKVMELLNLPIKVE